MHIATKLKSIKVHWTLLQKVIYLTASLSVKMKLQAVPELSAVTCCIRIWKDFAEPKQEDKYFFSSTSMTQLSV